MPEERRYEINQEINQDISQDINQDMNQEIEQKGMDEAGNRPGIGESNPVKAGRRFFSKIGFIFLAGSLAIACVQALAIKLVYRFFPQWMESTTGVLLVTMLVMYLLAMPLMVFIISRLKSKVAISQHRMTLGQWILAAFMSYGITYGANLIGTALTVLIGLVKGSAVENVLVTMISGSNLWVVFLFMVLCAPVFEEFIFRKLLVDRVVVYGEGVAVVLSGLIFGLFHGNLSQFSYAFFIGIFFAFIYVKTGRIRYTIALHMAINFVGSVLPIWIMKLSHYDEFMEALTLVQTNMAEGMARLQAVMPGVLLFAGYALVIFGTAITGIILLLVHRKKFKLMPGQKVIPKGKRFVTVIVNAGMILFCVYWIAQIIVQLIIG